MLKILLTLTLLICGNLLAFLTLGHILDAIFKTGVVYKIVFIILSIPALALIMYHKSKPLMQEIHNLSQKNGK